ncbi:MAG: DsrE family protein [Gammaproteobacteria bacterium]
MAESFAVVPQRRVLVVCTHAPETGFAAREALDLALGFAAFDQDVALLFTGDGLRCLLKPAPGEPDREGIAQLLGVMPDYGITRFIASVEDLARHLPGAGGCAVEPESASAAEIAALIPAHDLVLRC